MDDTTETDPATKKRFAFYAGDRSLEELNAQCDVVQAIIDWAGRRIAEGDFGEGEADKEALGSCITELVPLGHSKAAQEEFMDDPTSDASVLARSNALMFGAAVCLASIPGSGVRVYYGPSFD